MGCCFSKPERPTIAPPPTPDNCCATAPCWCSSLAALDELCGTEPPSASLEELLPMQLRASATHAAPDRAVTLSNGAWVAAVQPRCHQPVADAGMVSGEMRPEAVASCVDREPQSQHRKASWRDAKRKKMVAKFSTPTTSSATWPPTAKRLNYTTTRVAQTSFPQISDEQYKDFNESFVPINPPLFRHRARDPFNSARRDPYYLRFQKYFPKKSFSPFLKLPSQLYELPEELDSPKVPEELDSLPLLQHRDLEPFNFARRNPYYIRFKEYFPKRNFKMKPCLKLPSPVNEVPEELDSPKALNETPTSDPASLSESDTPECDESKANKNGNGKYLG